MSPEQAKGQQDIDERTDIWSMCVMLYEMISGTMPFQNRNYNALMQAILNDDPVPTTEISAGDAGLWRVIERGLKKKREDRWSSMTELGEALALWLYEHGVKEDVSGNSIRALWLDAALSGVRVEVSTGAETRTEPPMDRSEPPSPAERKSLGRILLRRAKRARRYLKKHALPVSLVVLGILLGAFVTLLSTGPARVPEPSPPVTNALDPAPKALAAPAKAEASPETKRAETAAPSAPSETPRTTSKSKAATTSTAQRKSTVPAGGARPKKKSIHDFGF
jgi:serine/threonine-protein kinase